MELLRKLACCTSRTFRYIVFSTLLSFGLSFVLIILNFILGVRVSVTFYLPIIFVITLVSTVLLCAYNSEKLFLPLNKPLITKLEKEKVERARLSKRRDEKRRSRNVS